MVTFCNFNNSYKSGMSNFIIWLTFYMSNTYDSLKWQLSSEASLWVLVANDAVPENDVIQVKCHLKDMSINWNVSQMNFSTCHANNLLLRWCVLQTVRWADPFWLVCTLSDNYHLSLLGNVEFVPEVLKFVIIVNNFFVMFIMRN